MIFSALCASPSVEKLSVGSNPMIHDELVVEANANYNKGEQSLIYGEKQAAFNRALKIYIELVDRIDYPSGQLYQTIANSYFQLGEMPWAILYYERALKLNPRNLTIQNLLIKAKTEVGLEDGANPISFNQKLLPGPFFPVGKSVEYLMQFSVLAILFITLLIWIPNKILTVLSSLIALFSLLLLFNILLNLYFNPVEGILIQSSGYYREPSEQQSQLTVLPKRAGIKMKILSTDADGAWLKSVDSEGLIGYIPASSIRII